MIYCNVCGAGTGHTAADDPPFHAPCPHLKDVVQAMVDSPPCTPAEVKGWVLTEVRRWAPPITANRVAAAAEAVGIDGQAALVAYERLIDEGKLRMDSVWGIRAT